MPDELFRQEYLCDFSAANVGAIFGRYIEALEKRGAVCEVDARGDPFDVFVTSDIGYRDKAAFVWWRRMRGGFEIFHYDEGTGMDAEDWIERLREQPQAGTHHPAARRQGEDVPEQEDGRRDLPAVAAVAGLRRACKRAAQEDRQHQRRAG